ncbi:trace amine-associated receptor 3 [Hydra vulgaris]|uniref:Trace amine-associated receptor 3 n=1 Tax=Hydra vulgaris TaxID=6087 RepID=A0ABM4BCI0_HYDVU
MEKIILVRIILTLNQITSSVHSWNDSAKTNDECREKTNKTYLMFFVILIVMVSMTIIGNIFVIIIISFTSKLRQNTTYVTLLSLAVVDFLVGCITMPYNIKRMYNNRLFCLSKTACKIILIMEPFLSIASMNHLFSIAVERFLSLKLPFQFKLSTSSALFYTWLLSLWVYAFLWSFLGMFKWNKTATFPIEIRGNAISYLSAIYNSKYHVCTRDNKPFFTTVYVVCFCLPIILMGYIYYFVYKTTSRHIRQMSKLELGQLKLRINRSKLRQQKLFTSVFIVFLVYVTCWLPTFVIVLLSFYFQRLLNNFENKEPLFYEILVNTTEVILPPLNSAVNPFIYVISNRKFKNSALSFLNKKFFNRNKVKSSTAPTTISKYPL